MCVFEVPVLACEVPVCACVCLCVSVWLGGGGRLSTSLCSAARSLPPAWVFHIMHSLFLPDACFPCQVCGIPRLLRETLHSRRPAASSDA